MKKKSWIEVPSDIGAGKRGASLGIQALYLESVQQEVSFFLSDRRVPCEITNESLWFGETPFKNARNIPEMLSNCEKVRDVVFTELANGYFPCVMAGDHGTATGTLAGIKKWVGDKKIGVVWIDAHADLHSPYTSPSGNMHGMPLGAAIGDDNQEMKRNTPKDDVVALWESMKNMSGYMPCIDSGDIVFVSARDIEPEEKALMEKHSLENVTTKKIREKGLENTLKTIQDKLSHCDYIYISFDVDSMDPTVSEGTGTPVENGITPGEVTFLLKNLLSWDKTCCFEIVEINPLLDKENKMAKTALKILRESW